MLKKYFSIFITIILILGMCLNVNATNEDINIEKTVTNYERFESENGGEVMLKISGIDLKSTSSYKYQL